MKGKGKWLPPLTAFLVLSLLDMLTTRLGLAAGLREANSLAVMLLERGGEATMYGFKATITLLVVVFVMRLSLFYPRIWGAVKLSNGLLYLVVSLNVFQALAAS